ncbi:hypothetical protein SSX86_012448 [Deinandra increscens subsp. villosa]|uniref:CMP-sialic acid transporter 1 n=1 Tax=Deinandra increscens subsp. villosa TaxID=3103831 RepID=A0AAP0H1J4_9ASTR
MIARYRITDEGHGFVPHKTKKRFRVESGQLTVPGPPPPVHVTGIGPPILDAILMTLYRPTAAAGGILTTLSQSNGGYKYDYATIPFLAEIFKDMTVKLVAYGLQLLVSSIFLWRELKKSPPPRMTTEWESVRLLFLKRKLSNLQWMAIVLLAIGTTTSQVKGCGEASCDSLFSSPIQGYMLGVLSACLSALAGVYTEFLMKKNNDTLYWQNVQLYTFGAIFNMGRLLLDDFRGGFENGPWWERLFSGYTITTWLVVLNLGSTGLLVSWLMKYADNIVKVYSTSMAMLLTMVLSVFLFTFRPTLQLLLGIIICIMSLHMYFAPPSTLVELPVTVSAPDKTDT